jgi:hypothetical protein
MNDPQYICDDRELAIRHAIYLFFQQMSAAGSVEQRMEQDWRGNILHINGAFRPAELAHRIYSVAQDNERVESNLLAAARLALNEMCNTVAPRNSFTDAVDALDAAITGAEQK